MSTLGGVPLRDPLDRYVELLGGDPELTCNEGGAFRMAALLSILRPDQDTYNIRLRTFPVAFVCMWLLFGAVYAQLCLADSKASTSSVPHDAESVREQMSMTRYQKLQSDYPFLFTNDKAPLRIIFDQTRITAWQAKRRAELAAQGLPLSWADIGVVLEDPYILMIRDLVEFPNGSVGGYIRLINRSSLSGNAGVVILPMMGKKVLLLSHFRHATRSWHLEIPRGFGERDLSPADSARQEIREEVGGEILELQELGIMHSDTGMAGQKIHIYFARLSSVGDPEKQEGIDSFRWATLAELEELIRKGEITDAYTITAYTRAKLQKILDLS